MQGRPPECGQSGSKTRCQRTSGRSSSQGTKPSVARSMAGQRSGGVSRWPDTSWLTAPALMPSTLAIAAWLPRTLAAAVMAAEDMHYCSTAKSSKQATLNQSLFSVAYMSERDAERQALAALLGDREKKAFAKAIGLPEGASMLSQHLSGHRPISFEAAVCYAQGLGVTVRAISPRLADLAFAAIATPSDGGEPSAVAFLPRAALNRPDLAAALETLGAELAADMPQDLRQDVADTLSKLAMRCGLARHQTELITLLHTKPAKQVKAA